MQAEMPFFECPENALRACIEALGGAKKVGSELFKDKTIDNARDYLLACVNETRPEKLNASQIIYIFREAHKIGFHAGFNYFADECKYQAIPIEPQDENARLQRDFIEAINRLDKIKTKLQANGVLKAVA